MNNRQLHTPLTIGSFLIASLTGLLLFIEVPLGGIRPTHEWMSLVFVVACGLHIFTNRKPFARYFSGSTLDLICTVILAGSLLFVLSAGDPYLADASYEMLVELEIRHLPLLLELEGQEIAARIQSLGIAIDSDAQSLRDLAAAADRDEHDILEALITGPR